MQKHVTLLGVLFIVYHSLGLLFGLFVLSLLSGIGMLSGDWEAVGIMALIGLVGGSFLIAVAVPGLVAGIGLLKRKTWVRILALIIAFLKIIEFPLGTILAAYAFWVLMQDETERLFQRGAAASTPAM